MGVVNVTPDSFSNGGRFLDPHAAVVHGLDLAAAGAAIIDVGGESTRPGAEPVAPEEELRRVLPVVEGLRERLPGPVRISVDTRSAVVAEAAVDAGATIINDISASLWPVAADRGVGWIAGHLRGEPRTMQEQVSFQDVVTEVRDELLAAVAPARAAGLAEIWIDPGIGFGKTAEHNLQLLRHLRALVGTGLPVVVGTSRKSFLGRLASPEGQPPAPPDDRLEGSLATAVWAVAEGAAVVRAHDVAPTVQAIRIVAQPVEASR
jgi:dihydropteroate synthase